MLMKGGEVSNSWAIFLVAIILLLMSVVVYLLFVATRTSVSYPVPYPPPVPGPAVYARPPDVYTQPYVPPVKMDYPMRMPPAVAMNYAPPQKGIYDLRGPAESGGHLFPPPTPMGLPAVPQNVPMGMAPVPPGATTVNYPTQGVGASYSQLGILMRHGTGMNAPPLILPLMGRRIMNGRDKLQYFTISNTGMVNTKLPIRVKGKSCMNEYGCNELYSGDTVFVEGYNEEFVATIYENATMAYMPI
jgi:hypothetical protein